MVRDGRMQEHGKMTDSTDPAALPVIDAVRAALGRRDAAALVAMLEPLHAADIADLLEQISAGERRCCCGCGGARSTATSCRKSTSRSARR
jgi:hypothetical protein